MFSTFKSLASQVKQKINQKVGMFKATLVLSLLQISIEDQDSQLGTILFTLDNGGTAVLVITDNERDTYIGTNLVFDTDAASLKTMSDIADIAAAHRCLVTGLSNAGEGRVKLALSYYDVGQTFGREEVSRGVSHINRCLESLTILLQQKVDKAANPIIDLSMFEDMDLTFFNPRQLGERKEFSYYSWENYAKAALSDQDGLVDVPSLDEIAACKDFEEKNDLLLADVGDSVLSELKMHRILSNMGDHSIQ